jgi:hypothetical protein
MSDDINCPYCDCPQEICHEDGYGYEEDQRHEQCCTDCEKEFVFTTSISFHYEAHRAHCLNDGVHILKPSHTAPKWATKMVCDDCDYERPPTPEEKKVHNIPEYKA